MESEPEKSRKIVVAGDSLLHRMNANKMSVDNITSVKLTKKDDILSGKKSKNYISRHGNDHIDLVLLAGTNDLANRKTSPEELIEELDKQITELKAFNNLGYIFLCKIPHRFDFMLSTQKSSNLTNFFMNVSQILKSLLLLSLLYHPSSNFILKMVCILVMSDYPNFVAYCFIQLPQ